MIEGHGTLEQVINRIKDNYSGIFDKLMLSNEDYKEGGNRFYYECTLPDVIIASLSFRQNENIMIGSRIKINFELAMKTQFPQCYRALSFIYLASNLINEGLKLAIESKSIVEERRDEPLFQHSNTEIEDFILGNATELSESFQKSAKLYKPVTENINRDISLLTRHRVIEIPDQPDIKEIIYFLH